MPDRDFYPASMDAKVPWHANLAANLPGALATKYGISAGTVAAVQADSDWIGGWVAFRHAEDTASQQLTKYFNTIAGNDSSVPAPAAFSVAIPGAAIQPTQVAPGVEKRVRDLARDIKGRSNYSEADGELLGIVAPGSGGGPSLPDTTKPVITLTTRVAFEVGVKFRKLGMDGIRIEYRHSGGAWLPGGTLITSPGTFTVAPATPGTPEQVEVRAVYLKGNNTSGEYSDTGSVYVGP